MIKKLLFALLALFAAAALAAVDVNKADQAALETIKGIGPAISGKIIDERKKSPFKDWADMIERVNGIGEGNAAKFSAGGLTVNGAAFKGAPAAKPAAAEAKKEVKPVKADEKKPAVAAETKASAPVERASAAKASEKKK
jgi:competence protein ComEA